jgi:hypothetical protein
MVAFAAIEPSPTIERNVHACFLAHTEWFTFTLSAGVCVSMTLKLLLCLKLKFSSQRVDFSKQNTQKEAGGHEWERCDCETSSCGRCRSNHPDDPGALIDSTL